MDTLPRRGRRGDEWPPDPIVPKPQRFPVEFFEDVRFDADAEWLIEGVLPCRGVAAIFGDKHSFKSFAAMHIALSVAAGRSWAGRRAVQAGVAYIAAEGGRGQRKRVLGYRQAGTLVPPPGRFALIAVAPDLGKRPGDVDELVHAIESARLGPGLIVLDTLAAALGGADENGSGAAALVANALEMADRLNCLVLLVHHVGHDRRSRERMRGHSMVPGSLDAQLLCERPDPSGLVATLTLKTLRDGPDGFAFEVRLVETTLGQTKTGRPVTTLVVDEVRPVETASPPLSAARADASADMLRALDANPGASLATLGKAVGVDKNRAGRLLAALETSKPALARKVASKWTMTAAGKAALVRAESSSEEGER